MGRHVVQRQGTLHRHIVEVAQHGLWIGHGQKVLGEQTGSKDKGISD
jgi:hypothetical protein